MPGKTSSLLVVAPVATLLIVLAGAGRKILTSRGKWLIRDSERIMTDGGYTGWRILGKSPEAAGRSLVRIANAWFILLILGAIGAALRVLFE